MTTDRIEFRSFDGLTTVRMGQGDHCVLVQIVGAGGDGGIVLTDDEAEAMARSLLKRVEYSRGPKECSNCGGVGSHTEVCVHHPDVQARIRG